MIEAAGITLREAIEAILVIFIMVTYLQRTDQAGKKKFVYGGALIAVALSAGLAVLLSSIGINPENEFVEGILYFIASILVATLTIWMIRHAKHFKTEIETKLAKSTSALAMGAVAFVMVFREGAETVIFLQSLLLSGSSPVENFLGGLFGIILALVFGFVFLRGTSRIDLSRFFRITAVILFILAIELFANGLHEFFELQLLPSNEWVLGIVGFLSKDSTGASIIGLMMFALIGTVLYDLITSRQPDLSDLKPAAQRKKRYEFLREKYSKIGLASVITILTLALLTPTITAEDTRVPEPVQVEPNAGEFRIPVPKSDGLYKYVHEGKRIMVAAKNGTPHVALDRCYICPPKPYGYDGQFLICSNCGAPIKFSTVGNPGGCNPRVIDYTVQNNTITISRAEVVSVWEQ